MKRMCALQEKDILLIICQIVLQNKACHETKKLEFIEFWTHYKKISYNIILAMSCAVQIAETKH